MTPGSFAGIFSGYPLQLSTTFLCRKPRKTDIFTFVGGVGGGGAGVERGVWGFGEVQG